MIKKLTCIAIMICVLISTTGCGETTHSDKLVLALRSGTYSDVIKQCLGEFEKEHGITCEVYELSEDDLYSYILSDSVRSKGAYDLCMVDGSWVSDYIAEDVLTDLGELGYSFDDDIIPQTTSICVQNGKTYLVPYYGNVTVMMYNKRIARELGFDGASFTSLDEVMDFCCRSAEQGNGGFVYRGDTENNIVVDFLPILCTFGGWVVDENNKPTVNTEAFTNAMNFYMKLTATGTPHSKDDLIAAIEKGDMVAAVGWPGWYSSENVDLDYTVFPGRFTDESPAYNSNIYGIWTLGIPNNCTNKELSCELLKYLMDKDVQKSTVASGGVPCRYSSLNDPELLKNDPHLAVICEALENGVFRPNIQEWPRFYTILGTQMKNILEGEVSLSDGLILAQEELDAMMK